MVYKHIFIFPHKFLSGGDTIIDDVYDKHLQNIVEIINIFVCSTFLMFSWFRSHVLFEKSTRLMRGRRGRDRMVVEFTTTCAISAYHS